MITRELHFQLSGTGRLSGGFPGLTLSMKSRFATPAGCRPSNPGQQKGTHLRSTGWTGPFPAGDFHVAFLIVLLLFCSVPAAMAQSSIKLAWDPNTESNLAGYRVYYGSASRTYGTPIDVGNTTSYTLIVSQPGTYFIAVTAYDTVSNESDFSNEVTTTIGSCAYSISPSSSSNGKEAGSGNVSVQAGAGCSWTANSNVPWISITSGAAGIGNGTVAYLIQANTGSSTRSGALTIAGQTFTITQAGGLACDLSGDGQLNAQDVQILVNIILGMGSCPGNCDLNHDGKVDAADLQLLTNVILGIVACP